METPGNQVLHNRVFDNGALGIDLTELATGNSVVANRTRGNLLVDLYDANNGATDCDQNEWHGNTPSGEVQPLGVVLGLPTPY